MIVDLHMHSTASDGSLAPAELMRRVAEAGVAMVALTDHDCIDGLSEAADAARSLGALGQWCRNVGAVVWPYAAYPRLRL